MSTAKESLSRPELERLKQLVEGRADVDEIVAALSTDRGTSIPKAVVEAALKKHHLHPEEDADATEELK